MTRLKKTLFVCLAVALPALSVKAQVGRVSYQIPSVDTAPEIDGEFSQSEWRGAKQVALENETHPSQNIPALVKTQVYLMEDGENIYLAFVANDPEPDKIRAFYRDRDSAWDDDFVGVVLDTFNDERRGFEFFANPLGVQMDLIMDDVVGNEDASWNAIWDSVGKINEQGYVVEMRIPLRQLRFPQGLEEQTWGIDLLRFYPRETRHRLSNNTWDYGISCYLCQLKKAEGFADLESRVNLQLIPTLTAGLSENRPDPILDDWQREDTDVQASLDLRWGVNQDMFLNATLNPDFSQVEADNAQLNVNNTFSLFFPERREFFLDGADYFNTQTNLVYTRNIASPDYGVKLSGKKDRHTYGLMFANDEFTHFVIPGNQGSSIASLDEGKSENAVLRYRLDVGRNSTAGLITTARRGEGYANTVAGLDGTLRLGDSDRIEAQVLRSSSRYPGQIQADHRQKASIQDKMLKLNYRHQGEHWEWRLNYEDFGEDFRADMGFINRVNYSIRKARLGHTWRPESGKVFNTINVFAEWDKTYDQAGLELEEESEVGLNLQGLWQSYTFFGYRQGQRYYNGRYFNENGTVIYSEMKPAAGMFMSLEVYGGENIDFANTRLGDVLTVRPRFRMQLGKHLQLRMQHNYQTLDVSGGRLYTTNLSDFRLTYQFGIRSFLRAIVQYSDTRRDPSLYLNEIDGRSKSLNTQFLYSYKLNAQTRFFLGYSDSGFANDQMPDIERNNRTVFAKFSYAWQY